MNEKNEITDKDWELIAKSIYDKNTDPITTGSTSVELDALVDEKERKQIDAIASQVDLYFEQKKYKTADAWAKVEAKIHNQSSGRQILFRNLIHNPVIRIAAGLIFAALLVVSGYEVYFNPTAKRNLIELSASEKVMDTFTLPDGTLVSLNSNTKLIYPKKFGRNTREVTIEGEAFFEVKPNKDKPFIIHAGNAQIKVLGTSFNVNAYPESKLVEVTVETGRVQVLNKSNKSVQTNELILTPGDKGTLNYESNSLQKMTNQNPNFLAWKTHNLVFKATSLDEVIQDLAKVYKVNIRIADSNLNKLLLTAQFNNYSLDFILEVIETTFKIETEKVDGQYILKARS
jgi:ferric-dicitrate binding protein FerR (iron transport regulator)